MNSSVLFNVVSDGSAPISVTAFLAETAEMLVADAGHANFKAILAYLLDDTIEADPDEVRDLFDVTIAIQAKFERLGERVTIKGANLFLDGDPLADDVLADTIVQFHQEGNENFKPLIAFLEKVSSNPDPVSRESLFAWMRNKSFHLLPNGNFIGYKGVADENGVLVSMQAGRGGDNVTVNDEPVPEKAKVPQPIGGVIEMPRSVVDDNRNAGCSRGLHVGTFGYASSFGHVTLAVEVNPRDVVSVPTDCNEQKMRTCRYTIIDRVTEPFPGLFVPGDEPEDEPVEDEPVAEDPIAPTEYEVDPDDEGCGDPDCWCTPGNEDDDFDSDEDDDDDDEPEGPSDRSVRTSYLLSRDRDTVRRIAREAGVVRGDKNKAELVDAIVAKEFES